VLCSVGAAALLGFALFASLIRLNLRLFFSLTDLLLIFFAAGMAAHSVREFTEIGWIPVLIPHIWDTNFLINEKSVLGQLMNTLFGYSGSPSLMELIIYLGSFVTVGVGRLLSRNTHARVETA
jgi:high-affinity iron transporter